MHGIWTAWILEPSVVLPLAIAAALYARGARRSRGVTMTSMRLFWSGWGVLALCLLSPLHPLGEVLFSAHMVQHELLMIVAAPLLVLSRPAVPLLWGLPYDCRRACGRLFNAPPIRTLWSVLSGAGVAWMLHAAAIWVWHAPILFEAAVRNQWVHAAQHISFFGSALLFWWPLFHVRHPRLYAASILYALTTGIHTGILGALLTFSPVNWYPIYTAGARFWGMSPLEDQQLGGLIMWVPASLVYLGAALGMMTLLLRESGASPRSRYAG